MLAPHESRAFSDRRSLHRTPRRHHANQHGKDFAALHRHPESREDGNRRCRVRFGHGRLSAPRLVIETRDPAHFTVSADGKRLYLCNTGTPGGVSAFAVEDAKAGALRLMNYKESKGRGPSYVSVDKSGRYVLDANYGGGFVEVYSLAADGSLDQQTAFVEHQGSSVHPQRQTKPYAHWIPHRSLRQVRSRGRSRHGPHRGVSLR